MRGKLQRRPRRFLLRQQGMKNGGQPREQLQPPLAGRRGELPLAVLQNVREQLACGDVRRRALAGLPVCLQIGYDAARQLRFKGLSAIRFGTADGVMSLGKTQVQRPLHGVSHGAERQLGGGRVGIGEAHFRRTGPQAREQRKHCQKDSTSSFHICPHIPPASAS